jgi:acetyl-CoA acetyltransferase
MFPRNKAAIVGIGQTPIGRLDRDPIELYVDASLAAISDAGIDRLEIDGIISTGVLAAEDDRDLHRHHIRLAEQLGIRRLRLTDTSKLGGAAIGETLRQVALYMEAGMVETVLIAGADAYRSRLTRDESQQAFMAMHDRELEGPYGHTAPTHWAINAQRYMKHYDLKPEDLASVAVTERKWAIMNPLTGMSKELTVEDVLNSPMISSPLHLYDCSRSLDGGAAIIVTTRERAAKLNTEHAPVYVRGVGSQYSQYYMADYPPTPQSVLDIQKASCDMAYEAAGVTPADIDLAFPYDGFSVMVWMHLDAMGFLPPGQAAREINKGWCAPGGALPINTHGGALNSGLPAFPAKFFFINEAVRQLRGECGERQVNDASLAIFHGVSGVGGVNASVIFERE